MGELLMWHMLSNLRENTGGNGREGPCTSGSKEVKGEEIKFHACSPFAG